MGAADRRASQTLTCGRQTSIDRAAENKAMRDFLLRSAAPANGIQAMVDRPQHGIGDPAHRRRRCHRLDRPGNGPCSRRLGTLDQMLQQFQTHSNGWGASLRGLALNSFYILAVIDIAVAAVGWAFRGGDLGDFLGSLVGEIMFLGIFLALLENSVSWSQDIISSFRQGAASTGASAVTPSAVFAAGVSVAKEVMDVSILFHPIDFVAFMIAGIVIVICFAGVAATMIVTLVESYLVIQAGVLLMAFGGSRWTKDIALQPIKYAVAVGAKLMMLQFIASLGTQFATQWATGFNANNSTPVLVVIGCAIVLFALRK